MNDLLWTLRRWGRKLGRTGIAGLALIGLALVLRALDVAPLEAEIAANATRIAELEAAARTRAVAEAAPAAAARARAAALPASTTPLIKQAAERVRELEKLAKKHRLTLLRGQYTPQPVPGTTLVRWQIVFPIQAPYVNLRAFVADSLAAMPTLALDDIRLKREKIGEASVDADLRFNLYLQEARP